MKARKNLTIFEQYSKQNWRFDDSENENYHNSERKRIRIISDIERESETKDADENEENIVKAGSRR